MLLSPGGCVMSADHLITAYRVMYRFAGQWEPPPALYRAVAKWAAQTYAEHVLGIVEAEIDRLTAPQRAAAAVERIRRDIEGAEAAIRPLRRGKRVRFDGADGTDIVVERTADSDLFHIHEARGTRFSLLTWGKPVGLTEAVERVQQWLGGALAKAENKAQNLSWRDPRLGPSKKPLAPRLVTLNLIRTECLRYGATNGNQRRNKVEGKVDVDVSGWRYLTPEEQKRAPGLLLEHHFTEVKLTMFFAAQHDKWEGQWHQLARHLQVDAPAGDSGRVSSVGTFRANMHRLLDTIWHEVQHVGQNLLKTIKSLPEVGGLPSKSIRNPEIAPSGVPLSVKPSLSLRRRDQRVPHHMRDVEFYTNLNDDIRMFIKNLRSVPAALREDYFKFYVGASRGDGDLMSPGSLRFPNSGRMWKLRDEAPEKWVKLVKELRKAVESYL